MTLRVLISTSLAVLILQVPVCSDDQLSSTMTLDQLQAGAAVVQGKESIPIYSVQPAAEVVPALKYRIYPAKWELKPGSALLHLNRALIHWLNVPRKQRIQWQSSEWLDGTGDGKKPLQQEMEDVVQQLSFVFDELHNLAMSEDFQWDHRLRDLKGSDMYAYVLPELQELRGLARMLNLRIRVQLENRNFDGAIASITDGIRLSEFVGQGEILIQKLVAIAIQSMMREQLTKLIATPGSPNLYWAMATIPRPLNRMQDAAMGDLGSVARFFPALAAAENETWSKDQAARRWMSVVEDLESSLGATDSDRIAVRAAIATIGVNQADIAKKYLIANGMNQDRVDQMPGLQAVLIKAARELRILGDDLGKAHLLPSVAARKLADRQQQIFVGYIQQNRLNSLSATIAGLFYPAVPQVVEAEIRTEMTFRRLMTVEAIRMYVSENGEVPQSLDMLQLAPAFSDPYTGAEFEYSVEESDKGPIVTLKAAGPTNIPRLMKLRIRFESLK